MKTELSGQRPTFTALPNWLRGRATPLELAVLWVLQSHFPNIHPSISLLAKETCLSRRSVIQVLQGMVRKGWIRKERMRHESGGDAANLYSLTIWDTNWLLKEALGSAGDAQGECTTCTGGSAPDAQGGVHEMHRGCARRAHKEDQEKKIKKKKTQEPPFVPPAGGSAASDATHSQAGPCLNHDQRPDQDLLAANTDPSLPTELHQRPLGAPASVQKQPNQPIPPWGPQEPLERLPEPSPCEEPKKPKAVRFQPTEADIPAILLPVALPLLDFWAAKAGKKTEKAWKGLLTELQRIWNDPAGGTDVLRRQLEMGIEAKTYGNGWQSITYANWSKYGKEWHRQCKKETHVDVAARAIAFLKNQGSATVEPIQSNFLLNGASL